MDEGLLLDFHQVSFSAADRCDRCGARALVAAFKDEFKLLFCGHHGRKMENGLKLNGFHIIKENDE